MKREPSYTGIDPGAKGAIAIIQGKTLVLFDAPMQLVKRGRTAKPTTDIRRLWGIMGMASDLFPGSRVFIEKVWGVRGQGASTGAALGHARCALECAAYNFFGEPPQLISPQQWKGDLGLIQRGVVSDKKKSLQLALSVFPDYAAQFMPIRGVRDTEQCIGRAEAALIAKWARENS